jgi:hypothetical protein
MFDPIGDICGIVSGWLTTNEGAHVHCRVNPVQELSLVNSQQAGTFTPKPLLRAWGWIMDSRENLQTSQTTFPIAQPSSQASLGLERRETSQL